jgi:hypothetical protein
MVLSVPGRETVALLLEQTGTKDHLVHTIHFGFEMNHFFLVVQCVCVCVCVCWKMLVPLYSKRVTLNIDAIAIHRP